MPNNILLPLDGSELAEQALQKAMDLAKAFMAKISLIYVFELVPVLEKDKEVEYQALEKKGEEYLTQIRRRIEKEGIPTDIVIKTGEPGLVICRYAEREDIDLVVMSPYGKGKIERWALGSVSDKVLRHSPKPVLLVRPPKKDVLSGRTILVVDDEADLPESVADMLEMCVVHKATSYDTALEYLQNYRYDIAILDIMGVNGFDLLEHSVSKGIPTLMLTAHALSPNALEKSAKLGAVCYMPKERILELPNILRDIIHSSGKPIWEQLFNRLGLFFRERFGWSAKKEQDCLKELESCEPK